MDMNELLSTLILTTEVQPGSWEWERLEGEFTFDKNSRIFTDMGFYEIFDPVRENVLTVKCNNYGEWITIAERPFTDYV